MSEGLSPSLFLKLSNPKIEYNRAYLAFIRNGSAHLKILKSEV